MGNFTHYNAPVPEAFKLWLPWLFQNSYDPRFCIETYESDEWFALDFVWTVKLLPWSGSIWRILIYASWKMPQISRLFVMGLVCVFQGRFYVVDPVSSYSARRHVFRGFTESQGSIVIVRCRKMKLKLPCPSASFTFFIVRSNTVILRHVLFLRRL
jgi:hypothetical protein